jgi:hypothetical protein
MENATYADLLNRKIMLPSPKGDYIAVEWHFFLNCLIPHLEKIKIDEKWYLKTHPDVQKAIDAEIVPDARAHYVRFGFFEHRMPYRILVDESWYAAQYPDIREAISKRVFASGQAHFEIDGFREGRCPFSGFRLESAD